MPEEKDIVFQVDSKEAETKLNALNRILKSQGIVTDSVSKITDKYSKSLNRSVVEAVAYTKAGEKVTLMMREWGKGYRLVEGSLKKQLDLERLRADAIKKVTTALREKERAEKAAALQTKSLDESIKQSIITAFSFERVILFFLVRRALYELTSALKENIKNVIKLDSAIAEIRTISQQSLGTFEQWNESILRASNKWGFDVLDVANAKYQLLSNQVATSIQEVEKFTDAALIFAKVTKSTAEESVDLLTAAINAFGMSTTDTHHIAASFFKTIELGRVRAEELANTLGRAAVPAAQLGITLDELNAMIATITIQGVKANESMTLLRGIFMKLGKPTKELKELFHSLGVTSGEELIQVYGLAESLKILYERTKGTQTEIAELFKEIRPTMGIAALVRQLDKFEDNLYKIKVASEQSYDRAILDQYQSSGEKLNLALNQTKNLFIETFSRQTIASIVDLTSMLNTTSKEIDGTTKTTYGLVHVVNLLSRATIAGGALFALRQSWGYIQTAILKTQVYHEAYTEAAGRMSEELAKKFAEKAQKIAFNASLIRGLVSGGLLVGTTALTYLISAAIKARELKKELNDIIQEFYALQNLETTAGKSSVLSKYLEEFEEVSRQVSRYLAEFVSGYSDEIERYTEKIEGLEKSHKKLVEDLRPAVSIALKQVQTIIDVIKNDLNSISNLIDGINSKNLSFQNDIRNAIRDARQSTMSEEEKIAEAVKDRAKYEEELRKAAEDVSKAKSTDEVNKALERSEELGKELLRIEKEIVDLKERSFKSSNKNVETLEKKLSNAEQKLQEHRENINDQLTQRRKSGRKGDFTPTESQKRKTSRYQQDIKEIEKQIKDAQSVPKNINDESIEKYRQLGEQQSKIYEEANKKLEELKATREAELKTYFDLTSELGSWSTEFSATFTNLATDISKILGTIVEDVNFDVIKEKLKTIAAENKEIESTKELLKSLTEQKESVSKDLTEFLEQQRSLTKEATDVQSKFRESLEATKDSAKELSNILSKEGLPSYLTSDLESIIRDILDPMTKAEDLPAKIAKFDGALKKLRDTITSHQNLIKEFENAPANFADPTGMGTMGLHEKIGQYSEEIKVMTAVIEFIKKLQETSKVIPKLQQEQVRIESDVAESIEKMRVNYGLMSSTLKGFPELLQSVSVDIENWLNAINSPEVGLAKTTELATQVGVNLSNGLRPALELAKEINFLLKDAANLRSSEKPVHKALGGMQRGTDTVPAMLSPGEFVLNAGAARSMMSKLVPMNFGHTTPNVSNDNSTNLSGVNITVSGGRTGELTAKSIVKALQRELRHGMKI
jgi:TP901 family phage tail tape measure protein